MNGFKLIAITPLVGCSIDFCKNLIPGKPYQFYSNYKITLAEENGRITKVKRLESTVPDGLYNLSNGISLNVSAVVGKNGTGKSALFELLAYTIYIIATKKKVKQNAIIDKCSDDLIDKQKRFAEDFRRLDSWINLLEKKARNENGELPDSLSAELIKIIEKYELELDLSNSKSDLETLKKVSNKVGLQSSLYKKLIKEEIDKEQKIESQLNVSLIYEVGRDLFELEFFEGKFCQSYFSSTKRGICISLEKFKLPTFFYSIVVNYSHHSYNSESIGNWTTQLFHKNDAYITPIVINPMRTKGNFDINHELKLSKERLLSNVIFNLVNNREYKLLNKYKVTRFIFKPKGYRGHDFLPNVKLPVSPTLLKLTKIKTGIDVVYEKPFYRKIAIGYLDYKIARISSNYSTIIYKNSESEDELLEFLLDDDSHISKKVRQTLNFLKSTEKKQNLEIWGHPEGNVTVSLTIDKLLKWLRTFGVALDKLSPAELVEYALPGFFTIDFELVDGSNKKVEFGNLSSGEQQMILNDNSVLYHLYNLQSVHDKHRNERQIIDRVKYENINIVFDEVELYYHPDMQRRLVKSIIDNLENIKRKREMGITSINICFLTHSPFILSDIPRENVLRLSENSGDINEPSIETFGANIYDLLNDSFFMEKGFIGEYAMKIIKDILDYILSKKFGARENKITQMKIDLIGDEIIREKLTRMLSEAIGDIAGQKRNIR